MGRMDDRQALFEVAFQFLKDQGFQVQRFGPAEWKGSEPNSSAIVFKNEKAFVSVEYGPNFSNFCEVHIGRGEDAELNDVPDWNEEVKRGHRRSYRLDDVLSLNPDAAEELRQGLEASAKHWKRSDRENACLGLYAELLERFGEKILAGDFSELKPLDDQFISDVKERLAARSTP